jgi:hypothetical protein
MDNSTNRAVLSAPFLRLAGVLLLQYVLVGAGLSGAVLIVSLFYTGVRGEALRLFSAAPLVAMSVGGLLKVLIVLIRFRHAKLRQGTASR